MINRRIVNSSPLIVLGKINHLYLLPALFPVLEIPQSVVKEISSGPHQDGAKVWLNTAGKEYIVADVQVPNIVSAWDLGLGETQVISRCLAYSDAESILDDGAARNCAKTLGIPVTGTVGVLMKAKKQGQVPAIAPLIEQILQYGFRVDAKIVRYALEWANE